MRVVIEEGVANCTLDENLIATKVKELVSEFKQLLEKKDIFERVIIDFCHVESIDSMGITFLIGTYKSFTADQKKISLKNVSDGVLQLFKIMKIDEIFEMH